MRNHSRLQTTLCAFALLFSRLSWASHGPTGHSASDGDRAMDNSGARAAAYSRPVRKSNVETPCFSFDELWDMHKNFWDHFLYPANIQQAKSINSTLLADNIIGRVDISRNFIGRELNTEYLFGLFTGATLNAGAAAVVGLPAAYEIIHFAATDYMTSSSVVITANLSSILLPIEIDAWVSWDSEKRISQYDATFRRFDEFLDQIVANAQRLIGAHDATETMQFMTQIVAHGICEVHTTYCNGTNQQYESKDACMKFLTQDLRFGKAWEAGRNTLICRMLHQYMIVFRPAEHCPHIGPTGGGMCGVRLYHVECLGLERR